MKLKAVNYVKLFKCQKFDFTEEDEVSEYFKDKGTLTMIKLRNYIDVLDRKSYEASKGLRNNDRIIELSKLMGVIYSIIFKNRPANYMSFVSIEVIKQIVIKPGLFSLDNSIDYIIEERQILNYLNKRIYPHHSNLIQSSIIDEFY